MVAPKPNDRLSYVQLAFFAERDHGKEGLFLEGKLGSTDVVIVRTRRYSVEKGAKCWAMLVRQDDEACVVIRDDELPAPLRDRLPEGWWREKP